MVNPKLLWRWTTNEYTIFKNGVLTFAKVYNQDGSIKSTYTQTSGNRGIMEIHTKEGNKETTMKVEVIYKENK